ncbi:MAG: hypothetical protein A2X08_14605 [Bacteroidetes bacterium GWA2_32_17]|nr:MAG: hypothetical protein A2X08_14605 [Bacteroidetes bacterium GWA2_32_17]
MILNKISYLLILICLLSLSRTANAQIYIEDTTITSGYHNFSYPDTIISPSVSSKPVLISSTAQVEYVSSKIIRLKNGFKAKDFSGSGYFSAHRYIATNPEISAQIHHVELDSSLLGYIISSASGAMPPYSFIWSSGEDSSSIYKLFAGRYTLTVSDYYNHSATASFDVLVDASWTDTVGVLYLADTIKKTTSDGWTSGACSRNILKSNEEGRVQYIIKETSYNSWKRIFGLSERNWSVTADSINYAFNLKYDSLKIIEKGILIGTYGTYATGDTLIIVREENKIKYYKNSNLLHETNTTMSKELIADCSIWKQYAWFKGMKVSFGNYPLLSINTLLLDTSYNYSVLGQGLDSTYATGNKREFWLTRILPSDSATFVLTFKHRTDPSDTLHLEFVINNDYQISDLIGKIDSSGYVQTILLDSSFYSIDNDHDLTFFNGDTTLEIFDSVLVSLQLDHGLVMSPDNDGIYDSLKVTGMLDKINIYSITVKDLSDNTIFTTVDKTEYWDGKVSGVLVTRGVYKYILVADDKTLNGQFLVEY